MSSERESANLAFYAIVYSKGLVEKQQLQGALNKATLDGLPLETVLLEAGAIKPAACVEVLSERAELGRTCRECEGVTYVLPDEDPSTKKCESCGGRLKRSKREEREARRTERQKRGVSGTHKRRPVATGSSSPATGSSSRELKALTDRLNELEAKLTEQVHQAVDTRMAQEDLQGYLDRAIPEQIERTLAEADLSGIVDRVSDEALQTVSARVEEADLSGLYDRVAEEAMEKVSGRLPAGGAASAPEVDTQAIIDDATRQALASVRPELEALEEQAIAKATERAMAMLQELKESSEEQASLAENGRLAVEEMLNQYDLPTLGDRITEQVLQALDARQEDDEEGQAATQGGAASPEVLERIDAIDASMQELLDEMVELSVPTMKQELEALTQLDLASLRQQSADDLAALTSRVDEFTSLKETADELRRKVDELIANPPKLDFDPSSLRAELREEAVEVATRKAISAAKEEMAALSVASEGASLEGLSGATDQVTAQVMQRLEERLETQSNQLADQAMAIIQKSLGAMDMSALTNKVMNEAYAGLEERLSELSLPSGGGGGGEVDMEALKAAVTEAVLPGLEANLAERLDRDLADLPDRIGQQAAGPVLQAIESRIEKLDLRNLPSKIAAEAMPVIAEQVTAKVLEEVKAAGGGGDENGGASSAELEKAKAGILEWVESRFAQVPPPEAIVQMATSKATDALEARLSEIEVKLAELEAAALTGGGGGSGASPEEVAQVVQAQIMTEVDERLAGYQPTNGGGGASPEEVAQVVQAQVMAEVEERLAGFQPSGGGGAEPEEVAQFVLAKVEERLAALPAGGEEESDGTGMAELAAQNALAAVEARLAELGGGGGGLSEERVEEIARKAALEVGQAQSASGELAEMAVPSGSSVIKLPGFEKKFISLAKEVKNLRQTLTRMQAVANESVASSAPTGSGGGGDLVAALNSPEFKQMFDNKINQVMGYMKSDVIPKTVKKVLADQ